MPTAFPWKTSRLGLDTVPLQQRQISTHISKRNLKLIPQTQFLLSFLLFKFHPSKPSDKSLCIYRYIYLSRLLQQLKRGCWRRDEEHFGRINTGQSIEKRVFQEGCLGGMLLKIIDFSEKSTFEMKKAVFGAIRKSNIYRLFPLWKKEIPEFLKLRDYGAAGGTWTRTMLPSLDFESNASAIPPLRLA